ncbi:carboxypeptidase-like regulatory domain-containing protein [Pseudoalteromonas rubra]|uniref:carboxypeptidase-like regulatory domain-containing protein n=1 Tax=Pseudoalteromonas rubra TaxID=43658 RepID=UPI000F7A48E3|nr:carboxypeptidase-like regulatory domain-containing protein [Pseudoalteromonas rubra]
MNKKILASTITLALTLCATASAKTIELPTQSEQAPSIYDLPGTYFDGVTERADEALEQKHSFPFQIRRNTQSLPAQPQFQVFSAQADPDVSQTPAQRSGCPELPLDGAIYLNFTEQGQIKCYSTEITEPSKIEGLLVNIPQDVDYNLFLFKLEDDNSFTPLDIADSTTASTEKVVVKAEPGAYIIAAEAKTGFSAEQSIMGWFSHPDFDQHEANDKPGQATTLPSNGTITGNIDNQNDLDYFIYQVGADQTNMALNFSASEQFNLELWTGNSWAKVPHNQVINIGANSGSTAVFLVRGNTENVPPTTAQYALTISNPGSAEKISNIHTWNNENLTNLLAPSYIEAHQELGMSGTAIDATGAPVPYASVTLRAARGAEQLSMETVRADANGKFSKTIPLPDCTGEHDATVKNRVTRGTATNPEQWWDINYNAAGYQYLILEEGNQIKYNFTHSFVHICKEKIVQTCYWHKDYASGQEEYICNRR